MPMTLRRNGMTDLVDLIIEDDRWEALDLEAISAKAAAVALQFAGVGADGYEICVMGCSDARIAELNAEFLEKPTSTNVIYWPNFELAPEGEGEHPMLHQSPE